MRFFLLISTCLFALNSQANCYYPKRSCFKLNNQSDKTVELSCWTKAQANAHSQIDIQLDLSWGDGLGAPNPTKIDCKISFDNFASAKDFSFYNPYWGSVMDFWVAPNGEELSIYLTDGWNTSRQSYYKINL